MQLTALQRSNFLEAFNAMDPPTNEQPEQLWIGEKTGVPNFFVVFVDHGCVVDGGPLSPEKFMEMIKGHGA